ncbi:MAG TPA: protein kinase [Vicinamibacterales bacterium]|nr:protein kinase [Vicinamibacterales bacterium]
MSLASGTRLGPYEVVAPIGAGGMGEVYRARDTRLGRDVAIKVLPALFAHDDERMQRFEREARTLAALNHSNIAQVHGLEELPAAAGGGRALVMEYVEGDDLSQRLARGPVPIADALPIARQIALALEAAHEQGIIHRDLKPANIKVKDDGTVKVLDFGLAKAMGPDGGSNAGVAGDAAMNSPTLTARATELGLILGTAAYMAPEQARGKVVDRRADIWSFGVVLTEMLTGERAFKGDDVTEVLAKVIEREPDLSKLPGSTPAEVRKLIARCLMKDPKQRLRDIGEARILLDEAATTPASSRLTPVQTAAPASQPSGLLRVLPWGVAAIAVALAGVAWFGPASTSRGAAISGAASGPTRLQIAMPPGVDMYTAVGSAFSLAPEGKMLAFVGIRGGVRQAFIRRFDSDDVTPIRGSEGAVSVVFSPDSREVLVGASDTSLRRIRLTDGFMTIAAKSATAYLGGWLADGRVAYATGGRLFVSGAKSDAEPKQLTQPTEGSTSVEMNPVNVPGANAIAFVSGQPESLDSMRIEVLTLDDGKRKPIVERGFGPVFTSTGHLLFIRDEDVLAVRFDAAKLETVGDPVRVLSGLTIIRTRGAAPMMTVAANGTLVYAASAATQSELVSVSRQGSEQVLLRMDRPAGNPRISPDGRQMLTEGIGQGLWLFDPGRRIESRMTDRSLMASFPIFGPGGKEVVYRATSALMRQPLDGSTRAVPIAGSGPNQMPTSVTADGTKVLYIFIDPVTSGDIYEIPIGGGAPRAVVKTNAYEGGAQVSPDGKWIVYVSNELGANEIFLQAYPASARRVQVSSTGGIHPTWNPRGGEIFYRRGDDMMSVRVTFNATGPVLAPPEKLFTGRYSFGGGLTMANYAVTPDGSNFLMIKDQPRAILNVVLNWLDEVKAAVK